MRPVHSWMISIALRGCAGLQLGGDRATQLGKFAPSLARRQFFAQTAFFTSIVPTIAMADDVDTLESTTASATKTYSVGESGTYSASSAWEQLPSTGFKDRFTQSGVCSSVQSSTSSTALNSIADLGKVELVDVSKIVVDLPPRADLVAAGVRTDPSTGTVYYSWDLAAAPSVCPPGDEFGGALGCSYDRIFLLSACVDKGRLTTFQVLATAQEWKGHGLALKKMRNTFKA